MAAAEPGWLTSAVSWPPECSGAFGDQAHRQVNVHPFSPLTAWQMIRYSPAAAPLLPMISFTARAMCVVAVSSLMR